LPRFFHVHDEALRMPYRIPQDLALDLALTTLLEAQVRSGHYATVCDARQAASKILQRSNAAERDVLAEAVADTALHDSMDFARLALSAVSGVGVWTYEVSNDCFYCDAGISELYGIDPVQAAAGIKRQEFLANVHPDDLLALRKTMAGGLVDSGDLELEYRIVHPGGEIRWVLSRGHTYFSNVGEPVRRTGVGIEMTAQRRLEQQLRQSQKMEAVGQLTGGLAHDFNNMLTGVIGSLDMLRFRIGQGRFDETARYLDAAQGAARRAASLTHRLLAFSRRQTLAPTPTDIGQLAAGMLELIRSTVGPSVNVQIHSEPTDWLSLVDANQLENALLNLCINARDAMTSGGSLTIRTGACELDAGTGAGRDLAVGEYLFLSVGDTGSGMTSDVIAHAFEPFFTTKPMGEGTGLGLSMIHGFVRQSGGNVNIESVVGQGTTMTLLLPRSRVDSLPQALARAPSKRALGSNRETVLVIDDDATIRMLITDALEDLGYRVREVENGQDGLQILQSGDPLDLLVTDVGLPGGINGRQVADAARSLRPGLTVLFITGYVQDALSWESMLDPGMHLMTKPFQMDELTSRVNDLIAERAGS
jgi:signal transduction histidine kinase/ActR/RegA family two-component response regulator